MGMNIMQGRIVSNILVHMTDVLLSSIPLMPDWRASSDTAPAKALSQKVTPPQAESGAELQLTSLCDELLKC